MRDCIKNITEWMETNKLKMNEEKTEIILCNARNQAGTPDVEGVCVGTETILFSTKAKKLGVYFDSSLNMQNHINNLSQGLFCELRKIARLSPFMSTESMKVLITSNVLSRLDYCNSLFSGLTEESLKKLQRVQNHAARLIFKKRKKDHITPLLIDLHWLPIKFRIQHKMATLCYKCLNGSAPKYLSDLIEIYEPSRSLRSSNQKLLKEINCKTKKWGNRAFSISASRIWNSLPLSLKQANTEKTFKNQLKTHFLKIFLNS